MEQESDWQSQPGKAAGPGQGLPLPPNSHMNQKQTREPGSLGTGKDLLHTHCATLGKGLTLCALVSPSVKWG